MGITTISRKGQITIPKESRERLGLEPGTKLEVKVDRGRILLEPLKKPSESMRGIARRTMEALKADSAELLHDMRREDEEEL